MSFRLKNHLGNVLTTVSDQKLFDPNGAVDNSTGHYLAQAESVSDYYPFGYQITSRSSSGSNYRYGFNAKEQDTDDEWGTSTTQYDYGFRIYNPGIARFMSVDPISKDYPMLTSYQFASNTPISAIDIDGLEAKVIVHEVGWDDQSCGLTLNSCRVGQPLFLRSYYTNNTSEYFKEQKFGRRGTLYVIDFQSDVYDDDGRLLYPKGDRISKYVSDPIFTSINAPKGIAFYASIGGGKEQRIDIDAEIVDLNDWFENAFIPTGKSYNQMMKRSREVIDNGGSLLDDFVRLSNYTQKERSIEKRVDERKEAGFRETGRDTTDGIESIFLEKVEPLYKPGGGITNDTIRKELDDDGQ